MCSLPLLGSHVLPDIHSVQDSLLFVGRQAAEVTKVLEKLLLYVRRKNTELLVNPQRFFPLLGGEILVAT